MINFNNLNKILSNAGHKYPNLLIFENIYDNGVPSVSIRFFYKKTRDTKLINVVNSLLNSEKALWNTKVYLYDSKIKLFRITNNVLIFKCSREELADIVSDIKKCDFSFNIMRKWQKRLIHENSTEPTKDPTEEPPTEIPLLVTYNVGNGDHKIECQFENKAFHLTNVDVGAVTFKDVLDYYKPVNIIEKIKAYDNGRAFVNMAALDANDQTVVQYNFATDDLNIPDNLEAYQFTEKIKDIGNIGDISTSEYKTICINIHKYENN